MKNRLASRPQGSAENKNPGEKAFFSPQCHHLSSFFPPAIQRLATPDEDKMPGTNDARMREDKMIQEKPEVQRMGSPEEDEMIQGKAETGAGLASAQVSSQIEGSRGKGQPLPENTREEMEAGMGADFSGVRVHTDSNAVGLNRALSAQAFTTGQDVFFNSEKFEPEEVEGKKLLAHELVHVRQQKSDTIQRVFGVGVGNDLQSPRFAGNARLEEALDPGGRPIQAPSSSGLHVRLIQQALLDAGQVLPRFGVDGFFGNETKEAVKAFQRSQGLTGAQVDGDVGPVTMGLLDNYFLNHGAMASIPQSQVPSVAPTPGVPFPTGGAPSELLRGTRSLTPEEIAEVERRRTTEVQAPPGSTTLPTFNMTIPGNPETYETRVENEVTREVIAQYNNMARGRRAQRTRPGGLHEWSTIENVGVISKRETDRVFGNYAVGPELRHGVNLFDAWEDKEQQYAAGGAAFEQGRVEWRVEKIFGENLHTIDAEHGAVQSRAEEAAILVRVRDRIIASHRAELIETDHAWPGFERDNSVFIQRFTEPTDAGNRDFQWQMFQTLIHEYIHSLEHPDHVRYRTSLGEGRGGKTYREGMTEYFTKIVLESTVITPALRAEVEGRFHDPTLLHPIPPYGGYDEAANAEAVVGVVGIRNAMAAFFLGRVDLIGG